MSRSRSRAVVLLRCASALCALALAACAAEEPLVDRVQENLVDKRIFQGEWWFSSTAIDVDYDEAQIFSSANAFAPFEGSMSTDYALDFNRAGSSALELGQSFPIARIRWVIDEKTLYAYRAYELTAGANDDADAPDFRGQPLAAFKIEAHVDIRRAYNTATGEDTNVRVENTTDRLWYEREYVRVDWSQNLLTDFDANDAQANALFTPFRREPTPLYVSEGQPGYPDSWRPQFVRVEDDPAYRFRDEWPKDERDAVHYMSFVTQETWSPGGSCLTLGGTCAAARVTMRQSFLRVPPAHEYAVKTTPNTDFDRFGFFRSAQPTYARGGADRASLHLHCFEDGDCGAGGACDTERHICVGGLTEDRGETDFLTHYTSLQNLYADSFDDRECVADWECDENCDAAQHAVRVTSRAYNECCEAAKEAGKDCGSRCKTEATATDRALDVFDSCLAAERALAGSTCDPVAHRCTIPVRDRPLRPVAYRLSEHFPPHLVREAFDAVAQWNGTLMRGRRAVQGLAPIEQEKCADGDGVCAVDLVRDALAPCQEDNPAAYCWCGSPEEDRGFCARRYDPFETPEAAKARGVPHPYDCHVQGPDDPAHPTRYEDYDPAEAYDYAFVGEECMLTLRANACDLDRKAPCEELGDLRYQFLTHIQHGAVGFGGVAQPLSDPTTGELIVSNASIAAESIESVGTQASQFFPVLRGEVPEDHYFTGENLRDYYARLGRVEHPVALAPSGGDGYSVADPTRPPDSHADDPAQNQDVFKELAARMRENAPRFDQLRGQDGRAAILSDRLHDLAKSPLATRLGAALTDGASPDAARPATTVAAVTAGAGATSTTPGLVAESPLTDALRERERQRIMSARNLDDFSQKLFNSQYWGYWADAFAGAPAAEAALRMQQVYARAVLTHEVGHALGLRHNFAGSLDRSQYPDAYFKLARRVPLPAYIDYDATEQGGNGDGDVTREEASRWATDLRKARDQRLRQGGGNVMSSTVMDYPGDMSDFAGLGRYDAAAIAFGYFDAVEAYAVGDVFAGINWALLPTDIDVNTLKAQGPRIDPDNPTNLTTDGPRSLAGIEYSDSYPRELWTYYRGGDRCQTRADCPHAAGHETVAYQPITQRCVQNPRGGDGGECDGERDCICSNFDDDFAAYSAGTAYGTSRVRDFAPVPYLFCHDARSNDLSWCTRFDAGESFQEVVEHYRRSWLERYPHVYFRNFHRELPARGASSGSVTEAVKIYQHLFFRANFEGAAYQNDQRPLGFYDQLYASADVLNWLSEIIAAPDVGSYTFDAGANVYRKLADAPGAPGSDLDLGIGQGFYLWSAYQEGLNGFFRLDRAGTFLDKYLAIEALTRRDWGLAYTADERYFINFYDLFEREVLDLFGGLVLRRPSAYAPRVVKDGANPQLRYLSAFRGYFVPPGDNNATTYPEPAIDGVDTEVLRDTAAIYALSEFPVYYDTSFEQRLLVFKLGSGDGYELPATRADGSPTCGWGTPGCTNPDYIRYDSDRLHTTYVAVVINPDLQVGIDERQLGFELLKKLHDTQERIRALEGDSKRTAAEDQELQRLQLDLERDESFVEYLIELARQFGISSWILR